METYKYKVTLEVEVEAFDDSDAFDAIQDEFGIGDQNGITVTSWRRHVDIRGRNALVS